MGKYTDEPCVTEHTAYIYDRGGRQRLAGVDLTDFSRVQWGRKRDATSDALIRIEQPESCDAIRETFDRIEPKRHELVIFRGSDRVWEGVVNRTTDHPDYLEVHAYDISTYVMGTPLSKVWDNRHPKIVAATTRFGQILDYELQRWEALTPPANIREHVEIHNFINEARTTAYTEAFEMTVGTHLQNMARAGGIDWTVVGRALHIWDVSRPAMGETRRLSDEDFDSRVIVTAYGSELVLDAYVNGSDGAYGQAHVTDAAMRAFYGPWTKIFMNYNEEGTEAPTQDELNSQARRNLIGNSPVPVEVRIPDNSSVRLSDDLTINDLVPGVRMPLLATLNSRKMSQTQKLDVLTVTETPDSEEIRVTLSPASREDSDTPPSET
jgi:hypothetical protein